MLHTLLVYDIPSDKLRSKVACLCEDYGLDRFQYSAFYGRMKRTHQEELMQRIERLLRKQSGSIQLIPVGQAEWQRRLVVEQNMEERTNGQPENEDES